MKTGGQREAVIFQSEQSEVHTSIKDETMLQRLKHSAAILLGSTIKNIEIFSLLGSSAFVAAILVLCWLWNCDDIKGAVKH